MIDFKCRPIYEVPFFSVSENGENGLGEEWADRGNAPRNFWARTAPECIPRNMRLGFVLMMLNMTCEICLSQWSIALLIKSCMTDHNYWLIVFDMPHVTNLLSINKLFQCFPDGIVNWVRVGTVQSPVFRVDELVRKKKVSKKVTVCRDQSVGYTVT